MSYTINKTDGSIFATVSDGTINTDSVVTIIGKNYTGYGEFIGENFIRMLENSANTTAPVNPIQGQLWFDSSTNRLKVYNGTTFKILGAVASQTTTPTSVNTGDMWFDTTNLQLKIYDGTQFILIGPSYTSTQGVSGIKVETIQDNLAANHVIVKLYDETELVGIISKDAEFTPSPAITDFPSTLKPGFNLATTVTGGTPQFVGQATDSAALGGVASANYLRSDIADSTAGQLSILTDTGLSVGVDSDATLKVSGSNVILGNITLNGDLLLQVNNGGSPTTVITLDGALARAEVGSPLASTHIANKDYVDTAITTASGNYLYKNGSVDITGTLKPATTTTYNLGDTSHKFNTVYTSTVEATTVNATTVNVGGNPVVPFGGALVYNSGSPASVSVAYTWYVCSWNSEVYDTANIHDNVTNPDRLTVPAGVSKVRLTTSITFNGNGQYHSAVRILKNGSEYYYGRAQDFRDWMGATTISTGVIDVTPGDYFTVDVRLANVPHSVNGTNQSFFSMQIIE